MAAIIRIRLWNSGRLEAQLNANQLGQLGVRSFKVKSVRIDDDGSTGCRGK